MWIDGEIYTYLYKYIQIMRDRHVKRREKKIDKNNYSWTDFGVSIRWNGLADVRETVEGGRKAIRFKYWNKFWKYHTQHIIDLARV